MENDGSSKSLWGGCPVCKESKGERKIAETLEKIGISYIAQLRFDDCKDKRMLPFDVAVTKDKDVVAIVEYDGQQHYMPVFGEESLKSTQKHDKIKDNYCATHGIPLLRIHYSQFDDIETIVKEFLRKLKLLPTEEPAA